MAHRAGLQKGASVKGGSPAEYVRVAETVPNRKAYPESGYEISCRIWFREIHVDIGDCLRFVLRGFKNRKVSHTGRSLQLGFEFFRRIDRCIGKA